MSTLWSRPGPPLTLQSSEEEWPRPLPDLLLPLLPPAMGTPADFDPPAARATGCLRAAIGLVLGERSPRPLSDRCLRSSGDEEPSSPEVRRAVSGLAAPGVGEGVEEEGEEEGVRAA